MNLVLLFLCILILLLFWAVVEVRRLVSAAAQQTQAPELLRNVFWEIRTSMNSILGFAEILSVSPFDSVGEKDRQEIVAAIQQHCGKILSQMNELLDDEDAAPQDALLSVGTKSTTIMPAMPTSCPTPLPADSIAGGRLKTVLEQLISTQHTIVDEQPDKPLTDYRILLVEDMEVNRLLTAFQLREMGAVVDVAENGQVGIDMIRRGESENQYYDLIVMDMLMPVMDGYEATRTLRASGFLRPILALTASAMAGDREKTIDAGCNDYLPRPATPNDLLESIRPLLFTFQKEPETKS